MVPYRKSFSIAHFPNIVYVFSWHREVKYIMLLNRNTSVQTVLHIAMFLDEELLPVLN